jgi:hypothetical protein
MGFGGWGFGVWGLGPIPNPQSPSPIPNPHSKRIKNIFIKILIYSVYIHKF